MHHALHTFDEALTTALARWNLEIGPHQLEQLRAHFEAVVETNRVMNLTRITDPAEAAIKHYADSLALLKWVDERSIGVQTVLDVGTGAGFPAVPLAVMRPDWSVTAIDATGKKIDFLRATAASIGLKNLHCEHAHAQHWKQSALRDQRSAPTFQLVVFRALKALQQALRQAAKHVVRDGWLVAYKTASVERSEQDTADTLTPKLQLKLHERYAYDLTLEDEKLDRVLYIYHRVR